MEPHTRKKTLLGGAAVVALLAVGLLATQAAGAFGNHGPGFGSRGHSGMAMCQRQNLTESNGDVTDGCVSFHADAASGTISAYTVKVNGTDVRLADSISVPALAGGSETLRRGYALHKDDTVFLAQGPGFGVLSRNGTALTIAFPAAATVTVHPEVSDWSPAGATIDYGTVKATLVLPKGSSITQTQSGNTLTIQAARGPVEFHLGPNGPGMEHGMGFGPRGMMHGGFGHGPRDGPREGPDGPRDGPRDGPEGPRGPPPQ